MAGLLLLELRAGVVPLEDLDGAVLRQLEGGLAVYLEGVAAVLVTFGDFLTVEAR